MKAWAGGVPGLVGGLMVAVGAVLPWVSVYGGLYWYPAAAGPAGKLMLVSGLLAASLGAVLVIRPGRLPFWGAGLAGFGTLALAGYLTVRLLVGLRELADHPFLLASPGYGPLVSLAGADLAFGTLFLKPPPGPNPLPAPGPTETRPPAPPPC